MGLDFFKNRFGLGGNGEVVIKGQDFTAPTAENKEKKEKDKPGFFEHASLTVQAETHYKGNGDHVFVETTEDKGIFGVLDAADSDARGVMQTKEKMVKFISKKITDLKSSLMPGNFENQAKKLGVESQENFKGQPGSFSATIVGVFKEGDSEKSVLNAKVAQWGDTAAYVFRQSNKTLEKVTQLWQSSYVGAGQMLTRKLGQSRDSSKAQPEIVNVNNLQPGDVLLLASDGIHHSKTFRIDNVAKLLSEKSLGSAEDIAQEILQKGKQDDDRSVVVIRIKEPQTIAPAEPELTKVTEENFIPPMDKENKTQESAPETTNTEKPKLADKIRKKLSETKNYLPSLPKIETAGLASTKKEILKGVKSAALLLGRKISSLSSVKVPEGQVEGELGIRFNKQELSAERENFASRLQIKEENSEPAKKEVIPPLEFKPIFEEPEIQPVPEPDFLPKAREVKPEEEVLPKNQEQVPQSEVIIVSPQAAVEVSKPENQKAIYKKVWEKVKNSDIKGMAISAGAGAAVRIGVKLTLETMSFGTKTAVAAAAVGVGRGAKEWYDQKKQANERLNKFVEELSAKHYKDLLNDKAKMFRFSEALAGIADKKLKGEKLTVKDLKEFLKVDTGALYNMSDSELEVRNEILEEIEKLKIDKMKIAVATLKGAAAGAIGSVVVGEFIEWGSANNWFDVGEKVKDSLAWAKKGLSGFGEPHNPGTAGSLTKEIFKQPIPALEQVPELKVPEAAVPDLTQNQTLASEYKEILKQKLYLFNSDRVESLTKASRGLIHDYLNNETLVRGTLGKENLSVEQMVYAEDYLRKALEKMQIQAGKQVAVPGEYIEKAVEKARQLTQSQLNNLTELINSPEHKLGQAAKNFMESQGYAEKSNDTREFFGAKPDGSKIAGLLIVDAVK